MFRTIAIMVISVFFSTTAYAHDHWQHRHHHRHHHHHHRHYEYPPYYRAYMPPMAGYYMAPNRYYAPQPMPFFDNDRYEPRHEHHRREW